MSEPGAGAGAGAGAEEDVVPRIRRGRGIRLNPADFYRIAGVLILLIGIVFLQRRCADGVAGFVTAFDADAGRVSPEGDGGPDLGVLRRLTDEEIRDAFDGKGADKLLGREPDGGVGASD